MYYAYDIFLIEAESMNYLKSFGGFSTSYIYFSQTRISPMKNGGILNAFKCSVCQGYLVDEDLYCQECFTDDFMDIEKQKYIRWKYVRLCH